VGGIAVEPDVLKRLTDPEVQRFLREKWDQIEERFAPAHVILFGSRINGRPDEWSDLDLVVVSDRFHGIRWVKRAYHFQSAVDPHLSMTALCYTPEEFAGMLDGIGVVADACREGVWLR
jgi:hypothetical protein